MFRNLDNKSKRKTWKNLLRKMLIKTAFDKVVNP